MKKLSETAAKIELGVYSKNGYTGEIRADEFLQELKGKRSIQKYKEMRDNNAIVGSVMYAVEQTLRDVQIKIKPADDSELAKQEADFLQSVLDDMDHSLDDHISEALSYLTYGFSWFEVVYKRREGDFRSPKKNSKFEDGRIGVKKIAIRAPWTVEKFEVDLKTGEVLGMWQEATWGKTSVMIPVEKSLYYRTTSLNNDPSGRSAGGTDNAMYVRRGMIKRDAANNTALVGAVDSVYTNETNAAWDVAVTADDTNEALKIEVTGAAATNINWTAKVILTEVGRA